MRKHPMQRPLRGLLAFVAAILSLTALSVSGYLETRREPVPTLSPDAGIPAEEPFEACPEAPTPVHAAGDIAVARPRGCSSAS